MTPPTTELWLRFNGIQAAYGAEFGYASPRAEAIRAADPYRQANASYSLVQRRAGKIVRHTLIDAGMGVMPSLLEFEHSHGIHVIDEVILTHPHFDHFAQLDWLSVCTMRNGRPEQPRPLPIYATQLCWDMGPNRVFPYLAERSEFHPLRSGDSVSLGDLTITPFAVEHSSSAPGALGFIVQHGARKIIFTGDCLKVPAEDEAILHGADVLIMDANTWHPAERTGHQSVLGNLRLIDLWQPKRAYMTHYSGYEDQEHPDDPIHAPLSFPEFSLALRRLAADGDIRAAEHGMIVGDTEPWPGD